jgi:hypothetical protein
VAPPHSVPVYAGSPAESFATTRSGIGVDDTDDDTDALQTDDDSTGTMIDSPMHDRTYY